MYGELFALSQRLADDTTNPCELVWGIGVATWQIPMGNEPIAFEYPLVTQELEVFVTDNTFPLEPPPPMTPPRPEVQPFFSCTIPASGASDTAARMGWGAAAVVIPR